MTLWLFAGAVMVTVGTSADTICTDIVDEPTLPSVSVTFAVIVCVPVDSDVVLKDEVLFAIEPSLLEYQFNEPDIVPSSVSDAVPVNVTVGSSVTFTGTASDTLDGTISGSLDWYSSRDGSIQSNSASFSTTSLSIGTHTITANVTDTDGNVGSSTVSVTILADVAPTVTITAPADNSQVTVGSSVTFTGTASDTLDGTISGSLNWYSSRDGSIANNTSSFNTTSLSTGTHTITANVTDTDGNVGSSTISVQIVSADVPTVTITAPANNHKVTVGTSVQYQAL